MVNGRKVAIGYLRDSWEDEYLTLLMFLRHVLWGLDCRFYANAVDFGHKGTNAFKHYQYGMASP